MNNTTFISNDDIQRKVQEMRRRKGDGRSGGTKVLATNPIDDPAPLVSMFITV